MFLITKFLATEALGKNTLADKRNSVGSCPLFVSTFTNVLVLHFKVKFDQLLILCREFYGHDCLQTCRYKTREL